MTDTAERRLATATVLPQTCAKRSPAARQHSWSSVDV